MTATASAVPDSQAALLCAALECAPFGIALIDEARRSVTANEMMRSFERARLLAIEPVGIRFAEPSGQRAFASACAEIFGTASLATVVVHGGETTDVLVVTVQGVPASGTIVRAVLLDEVRTVEAAAFETTLGFTPAEARIAALLVCGRDGSEICFELGLARETVRTHIKRLLQKTGSRRQSELVLTLARASMLS